MNEMMSFNNWEQFMEYWCGFAPEEVSAEEVVNYPGVEDMPHYPDAGSVCESQLPADTGFRHI